MSFNKKKVGEAGYQELIDFKEVIGTYVNSDTKIGIPTTRGKIHYDKNGGAHIVPFPPVE